MYHLGKDCFVVVEEGVVCMVGVLVLAVGARQRFCYPFLTNLDEAGAKIENNKQIEFALHTLGRKLLIILITVRQVLASVELIQY